MTNMAHTVDFIISKKYWHFLYINTTHREISCKTGAFLPALSPYEILATHKFSLQLLNNSGLTLQKIYN